MKIIFILALVLVQNSLAEINIPLQSNVEPPTKLSETGLFQGDVNSLIPSEGLIPYDINQALWVDYAKKKRFILLPPNGKILFSEKDPWGFPVGTILVKHFMMEVSFQVYKNLETRVLVRKEGDAQNWVGYTYQWNDADAVLVTGTASPVVDLEIDATADGGARSQKFQIPNRKQCLQCHNSSVGFVRSVRTAQINREESGANQLMQFNKLGLFDKDIGSIDKFISFSAISDIQAPLEERVRTYLDVNCSHCHNPEPAAMCNFTGLDFRYDQLDVNKLVESGHLLKGSKADSDIFQRMDSEQIGTRMPYVGSKLKDKVALETVGAWIDSLH